VCTLRKSLPSISCLTSRAISDPVSRWARRRSDLGAVGRGVDGPGVTGSGSTESGCSGCVGTLSFRNGFGRASSFALSRGGASSSGSGIPGPATGGRDGPMGSVFCIMYGTGSISKSICGATRISHVSVPGTCTLKVGPLKTLTLTTCWIPMNFLCCTRKWKMFRPQYVAIFVSMVSYHQLTRQPKGLHLPRRARSSVDSARKMSPGHGFNSPRLLSTVYLAMSFKVT
jgi:hypothetical protein